MVWWIVAFLVSHSHLWDQLHRYGIDCQWLGMEQVHYLVHLKLKYDHICLDILPKFKVFATLRLIHKLNVFSLIHRLNFCLANQTVDSLFPFPNYHRLSELRYLVSVKFWIQDWVWVPLAMSNQWLSQLATKNHYKLLLFQLHHLQSLARAFETLYILMHLARKLIHFDFFDPSIDLTVPKRSDSTIYTAFCSQTKVSDFFTSQLSMFFRRILAFIVTNEDNQ